MNKWIRVMRVALLLLCFFSGMADTGSAQTNGPAPERPGSAFSAAPGDSFSLLPTSADGRYERQADTTAGVDSSHVVPADVPFGVGERLRYYMEFSFVKAGLSEMHIVGVEEAAGRPVYHFRSRVRSTRSIDLIYKVRDVVESWIDVQGLYSHRFEKRMREGSYSSQKFFDYNHQTGWVTVSNENGPKGLYPLLPYSHDIISALYWVRTQDLEAGKDLVLQLFDSGEQYPLVVKVYGREEITVPAGTFDCWKVEPKIASEGLFKMAGRLWVWISADERRIPVRMSSKIPVGTVDGNLVEYRQGVPYGSGLEPPRDGDEDSWDW